MRNPTNRAGRPGSDPLRNAVGRMIPLLLLLVLPVLQAAAAGGGEDGREGSDGLRPGEPRRIFRRTVFMVTADPAAGFGGQELRFLSDSIFDALEPLDVALIDARPASAVLTDAPAPGLPADRAAAERADAWIAVRLSRRGEDLVAALLVRDAVGNVTLAEREFVREQWILRRLEREKWEDLASAVAEALPPITNAATLLLRGLPGTRVDGIDFSGGLVAADGTLSRELASPATYAYRASRRGSYPVRGELFLAEGGSEHEIRLPRGSRWSAEAYLHNLESPGFGGMFFIEPNYFFLRADLTTHLIGLSLDKGDDDGSGAPDFFDSVPLTFLSAQVGSYLRREDAFLRPYLALGAFVRLTHAGTFCALDPVAPGGLSFSAGTELSLNPRLRFFLEWAPLYYWTDGDRFRRSAPEGFDHDDGYVRLGDIVIQVDAIRAGGRYHF